MKNAMEERTTTVTATAALVGATLIAGAALSGAPAVAQADPATTDEPAASVAQAGQAAEAVQTVRVKVADVAGTFSFTQDKVSTNAEIARALGGANKVLCGASVELAASGEAVVENALDWQIGVEGDGVQQAFGATLGELAEGGTQSSLMGCTCLGNPADGRATVNANVTGVKLGSILDIAGLVDGANAVTFVCADGTEVVLPLNYTLQHGGLIVYQVNGEDLSQSVGGTNQLWLGATAARYFASDVVRIVVTCEDEAPAAPGTAAAGDTYANRPNVGVLAGASA